jgi:acyl carrier protein
MFYNPARDSITDFDRRVAPGQKDVSQKNKIGEKAAMIEHNGIHRKLTELFARKLNLEVPSVDTDLLGTGLLDSMTLVELLAQLEETFGVSTPFDDLELENFRSIASIAGFVSRRAAMIEVV